MHHYCANCKWNAYSPRITRLQYDLWYRLTRIAFKAHQVHPPKVKQPLHLLQYFAFEAVAREVPRHLQTHFQEATGYHKWRRAHDELFRSKSRWEYHLMLKNGDVRSWAEYQNFYKERRVADMEEDYYEEDDDGYWEGEYS